MKQEDKEIKKIKYFRRFESMKKKIILILLLLIAINILSYPTYFLFHNCKDITDRGIFLFKVCELNMIEKIKYRHSLEEELQKCPNSFDKSIVEWSRDCYINTEGSLTCFKEYCCVI